MTRYFAQNTPRAGLEHMMMSVPGFQKRGGGMMILSRFCYKPEDVDCRYCLHYRRRSCQVRTCPYIAERLKSGAIEYGEAVPTRTYDEEHFTANIEVDPSGTFYGWVFKFMGGIQIIAPQECIEEMKRIAHRFL